jgi:hypothetical protein
MQYFDGNILREKNPLEAKKHSYQMYTGLIHDKVTLQALVMIIKNFRFHNKECLDHESKLSTAQERY